MSHYVPRGLLLTHLLADVTGVAPAWCSVPGRFSELYAQRNPGHTRSVGGGLGDVGNIQVAARTNTADSQYYQTAGPNLPNTDIQLFSACALSSANSVAVPRILSNRMRTGTENSYIELAFIPASTSYLVSVGRATTEYSYTASASSPFDSVGRSIVGRYLNSAVNSEIYENGVLLTTNVLTVGSGTLSTSNNNDVCVGNIGRGSVELARGPSGTFYLSAIWNVLPSASSVQVLHREWKSVLRDAMRPRRIWVPASAASGPPTLAAIAASNLTASGARLTVT